MKVQIQIPIGENHSIEFGAATWNAQETSVRNRYDSPRGGFLPHSSSEIPLCDILPIITETVARDLLNLADLARIMSAVADAIGRGVRLEQLAR